MQYTDNRNITEVANAYIESRKEDIIWKKEYRQLKKQPKILKSRYDILICECGQHLTRYNLNTHRKSNIHFKRLQDKNIQF